MTTKERSVSLYVGYLKQIKAVPNGTNEEVDADVVGLMRFIKDKLIWNRAEDINAYLIEDDLTYALRIDKIDEESSLIKGQFAAINTEIIPKYEWNGNVNALPMPSDDAGLYYPCHFIYFLRPHHLIVEYNQSGPRINMLQKYLEQKASLSPTSLLERAFFQQIYREDIIKTIENMGSIAEVFVEVHSSSLALLRDSGMDRTLNLDPDDNAEDVIVKLAISREKGASSGAVLEKETFLAWLRRRVIGSRDEELLKVRARVEDRPDDSGASLWLDLMSAKYKDKIRVKINRDKSVDSESCYAQLQQAYTRMQNR